MVTTTSARASDARERLLRAAIDVFGQRGFAGASTRMIANAAGVNLQAINYYFGGKQGLYLAAADHIADRIGAQIGPTGRRAQARFARRGNAISPDEARQMLAAMLGSVAGLLFDEEWTPVARFIVREQMDPTEAFDRLYTRVMEPNIEVARRIVGTITGQDPRSMRVRLRTMSLMGSIIFFRIAHAAARRQLGWTEMGRRELAAIRELVHETVASVSAPAGTSKRRRKSA
jgi:AcrR family transcriptional regulator